MINLVHFATVGARPLKFQTPSLRRRCISYPPGWLTHINTPGQLRQPPGVLGRSYDDDDDEALSRC